jgi:lecithin:retinol acyltransferase
MRHESQGLWKAGGSCRDLSRRDLALDPAREPPVGAHLVTPRRGYTHHGIYVGRGRVVQYGGVFLGLRRGPVEEVALLQFARGRSIWLRLEESGQFDRDEVVDRARARLGEDRYNVLTNNCEHFCEWCVRGEPRSHQVELLFAMCCRARRGLVALLVRSLSPWRSSARVSAD